MLYDTGLLPENRSIALPWPEPDCRFSVAVFLSGGVSPRHVTRPVHASGCVGGTEASKHVPNRRQDAAMIHGATVTQANADVLTMVVATTQLGCEPPL